jgi:hypothetical protein
LPLASIMGVTIGLLGIIAAVAIVFGHHGSGPQPPYTPLSTVVPTGTVPPAGTAVAQPTGTVAPQSTTQTQPTEAVATEAAQPTAAVPTGVVQPTEALPPTEVVQPTQPAVQPTQPNTGPSQTISTTTFSLQVPTSWQVVSNKQGQTANEVVLGDPSDQPNALDIYGGQNTSATSAEAALQGILTNLQQQYPDAKACGNSQQATIGGVAGTVTPICFTFTPQGGAALSAVDVAWAGTNQSGSYLYAVGMMAGESNQAYFTSATSVLRTLQWGGGQ